MFYFIKRLSAVRIVAKPSSDCLLLLFGLAIALHHALDVSSFITAKDRLVFVRAVVNNCINGTFEYLTGSIEHIGNNSKNQLA